MTGESTAETAAARTGLETDPERTRLGGAAAVATAVAFVAVAGLPGFVVAGVVLAGWYLLGGTYAVAFGQVGVASLLAASSVVELAAVEVGLLGVLVAPVATLDRSGREGRDDPSDRDGPNDRNDHSSGSALPSFAIQPLLLVLMWVLVGVVVAWAAAESVVTILTGAVVLTGVTGLASYRLHRQRLVSLGSTEPGNSADEESEEGDTRE